jgi:hypothetical protein
MDAAATETADGASHETRASFTRLDLAKHSSKVIIEVMGDDDCVTIVTFGSQAKVKLPNSFMTARGKCSVRWLQQRAAISRAAQANFRRRR